MSKQTHTNPLSKREVEALRGNPYIASATTKTVRFTEEFKRMAYEWNAMEMISKTAAEASPDLSSFLLKAVTEEISFTQLQTLYGIPCGKDLYYEAYRKFFWLLSSKKKI